MIKKIIVLFLLILGTLAANLDARPFSDPLELRLGAATVQGDISAGQEIWYSVTPSVTGIITVETAGRTNTFLEVYDSAYEYITLDDDSGEGVNARVEFFAQGDNTYYVKLRGVDDTVSGPFRLRAAFERVPEDTAGNTVRARAIPLTIDSPVNVYLRSPSESRWFRFVASSNVTLVVETVGNMDTLLSIYDNSGNLIAHDDDSGEHFNARIQATLNRGTYFIEVKEFSGEMGRTILHSEIR